MKYRFLFVFTLFFSSFLHQASAHEIYLGGDVRFEAKTKHDKCKKYVERMGEAAVKAAEALEEDDDDRFSHYKKYIFEQKGKLKKCNKKQNDFWHKLGKIAPAAALITLTILF
jgi:hypothetical protein